jgi:hypothetical protein
MNEAAAGECHDGALGAQHAVHHLVVQLNQVCCRNRKVREEILRRVVERRFGDELT